MHLGTGPKIRPDPEIPDRDLEIPILYNSCKTLTVRDLYWWQVWDVGDRFDTLKNHHHNEKAANMMILSPTSENCHYQKVTNITLSPIPRSPLNKRSKILEFRLDLYSVSKTNSFPPYLEFNRFSSNFHFRQIYLGTCAWNFKLVFKKIHEISFAVFSSAAVNMPRSVNLQVTT